MVAQCNGRFLSAAILCTFVIEAFAGGYHYISPGRPNSRKTGFESRIAGDAELHEVRCCSAVKPKTKGWRKVSCMGKTKQMYALSSAPEFGGCVHAATWEKAKDWCTQTGGRLCTREEMEGGCTRKTGCGHDRDLIWTSTSHNRKPNPDPYSVQRGSYLLKGFAELPEFQGTTLYLLVQGGNGTEKVVGKGSVGGGWTLDADLLRMEKGKRTRVFVPEANSLRVDAYTVHYSKENLVSRFLTQTTFGPTRKAITAFLAEHGTPDRARFKRWLTDQMETPLTSHRAYARARINWHNTLARDKVEFYRPCDVGSRWTTSAFSTDDFGKKVEIQVKSKEAQRYFEVTVDGALRSQLQVWNKKKPTDTFPGFEAFMCGGQTWPTGRVHFNLAELEAKSNRKLCHPSVRRESEKQLTKEARSNFEVQFVESPRQNKVRNDSIHKVYRFHAKDKSVIILEQVPKSCDNNRTFLKYEGRWWRHEPQEKVKRNTITSPTEEVDPNPKHTCPNVPETFLNAGTCKRGVSCSSQGSEGVRFKLTYDVLKQWQKVGKVSMGVVSGLRLADDKSPCEGISRWKITSGTCANVPSNAERKLLNTYKRYLRKPLKKPAYSTGDITGMTITCGTTTIPAGVQLPIGDKCYTHVHPDEETVRDFSQWVQQHPGGPAAIKKYVIKRENSTLEFPGWHEMDRWETHKKVIPRIGDQSSAIGSEIDWDALPTELQKAKMRDYFSRNVAPQSAKICGSPYETEQDPTLGHRYAIPSYFQFKSVQLDRSESRIADNINSSPFPWYAIAFNSADQLRQRAAWALAQVLVIGHSGIPQLEPYRQGEPWANYYDIFVRNAFGNYGTILKEIAFSPMMGTYLTFEDNQCQEFSGTVPDENFAREFMQLFSIGLQQQFGNGTVKVDDDGEVLPTYEQDDIMTYARLWTGLKKQSPRGNIPYLDKVNWIDPMQINPLWHDRFPKADLSNSYLGHDVILCADVPSGDFLRSGARYVYTGEVPQGGPTMQTEVKASSPLGEALCAPDAAGRCTFPMVVTLKNDVPCSGDLCSPSYTMKVIKLNFMESGTAYYSYEAPPCVDLAFNDGDKVKVWPSGEVSIHNAGLKSDVPFKVRWNDDKYKQITADNCEAHGCQKEQNTCVCPIQVETRMGFTQYPTGPGNVRNRRLDAAPDSVMGYKYKKIGTTNEVGVFMPNDEEGFSMDAIFRIPSKSAGGKDQYFYNRVERVTVAGITTFKNPPAFMPLHGPLPLDTEFERQHLIRQIEAEMDWYINDILENSNTGPFIAHRLIQRLTTSNPSPTYLQAVVRAFRSGKYDGIGAGKYGDMAATFAAILLHPEARAPQMDADPSFGVIREPLLKVMHMLRSLELYTASGEVFLANMDRIVGQKPYFSPTVFNFYDAGFQTPILASKNLVSPELELSQSPLLINYLDNVHQLALSKHRGMVRRGAFGEGTFGSLKYEPTAWKAKVQIAEEVVEELSMLLTAGRLSRSTTDKLIGVYNRYKDRKQALWEVLNILMSIVPEFHTTQLNLLTGAKGQKSKRPKPTSKKDYKAIIVINLKGGADSWSALVPSGNCSLYDNYAQVRGNLALTKEDIQKTEIVAKGQPCKKMALHKVMKNIKNFYNQGDAAVISGIGTLVEDMTAKEFTTGSKKRPTNLFSHNSQQDAATKVSGTPDRLRFGIMGRMADVLSKKSNSGIGRYAFGTTKIMQGKEVHATLDANGFNQAAIYKRLDKKLLENISLAETESYLNSEFSTNMFGAMKDSAFFNSVVSGIKLNSNRWNANPGELEQKFQLVSKLIRGHSKIGNTRDMFEVSVSGWDSHRSVYDMAANRYQSIDEALAPFINEMKQAGFWDKITIVTVSEFGRTLTSNGQGSDHAWSGNHFVLGGGIAGKQIHGNYPASLANNPQSLSRGRMVPKLGWETMWKPMIDWFADFSKSETEYILPNVKNFDESKFLKLYQDA